MVLVGAAFVAAGVLGSASQANAETLTISNNIFANPNLGDLLNISYSLELVAHPGSKTPVSQAAFIYSPSINDVFVSTGDLLLSDDVHGTTGKYRVDIHISASGYHGYKTLNNVWTITASADIYPECALSKSTCSEVAAITNVLATITDSTDGSGIYDVEITPTSTGIETVPGPLPLLGVGTAFGYSRKLRKRIKTGKTPEVLSTIG